MKYLIVGSGGTGAAIGAFLANTGKDVTFMARGAHLEAVSYTHLNCFCNAYVLVFIYISNKECY